MVKAIKEAFGLRASRYGKKLRDKLTKKNKMPPLISLATRRNTRSVAPNNCFVFFIFLSFLQFWVF